MPTNSPIDPKAAARRAATVRSWQMSRRAEETQPKAISSISQKIKTTTFQTRGDQVVRGVAGKPNTGTAGSIKDLLNRKPGSPPSTPKHLGGGMSANFRPRI